MSSTPLLNPRNHLELKMDQAVATDEQIRQHLPGLFVPGFYLNGVHSTLSNSSLWEPLRSKFPKSFGLCLTRLIYRVDNAMYRAGFEYNIERKDFDDSKSPVASSCRVVVSLSNARELLKAARLPLDDIETLQKLSVFLVYIRGEIVRIKVTLPNFEDHIQRNKIEVKVFKDELSDLMEQEKDGGLTRNEQAQKGELEGKIAVFERDIKKDLSKLRKKNKQIQNNEQKISSTIKTLRDFLEGFDPKNPSSLPKNLEVEQTLTSLGNNALPLSSVVKRDLQTKQEAEYTVYLPHLERQIKADWFRRRIRKWVPRTLAVLGVVAAVGVATRDQISELIHGPQLDAQELAVYDIKMPGEAVVEKLEKNNVELAPTKLRILRAIGNNSFNGKDLFDLSRAIQSKDPLDVLGLMVSPASRKGAQGIVQAKTPQAMVEKLLTIFHNGGSINTIPQGESLYKSEISPDIVFALKQEFGEDIQINLSLIDKTDLKKVMGHFGRQVHQPGITYSVGDACNSNKELYAYLALTIKGEAYSKTHIIPMARGVREKACEDVVNEAHKPKNMETELESAKTRLKKYIQENLSENHLPLLDKATTMMELGGLLAQLSPATLYKNYEGDTIVFEIDPKLTNLFKIVFGDDVRLFMKKKGEHTMSDRVQPVLSRKFNVAELCEVNGETELEVVFRIGDSDIMKAFSMIVQQADFVNYYCNDVSTDLKSYLGIVTKKQEMLNNPFFIKYLTDDFGISYAEFRQNIEKMSTIPDLETYMSELTIKFSESIPFKKVIELIMDSNPNVKLFHMKANEEGQEDKVKMSVHPDLIRALKAEFGERTTLRIGAFIMGQMVFKEGQSLPPMPLNVFCTTASDTSILPLIEINIPIAHQGSIKVLQSLRQAIMDHEVTREICLNQINVR